jgi:hypothetical protein
MTTFGSSENAGNHWAKHVGQEFSKHFGLWLTQRVGK